MAYGRLDVFWPDGRFETYTLNMANISVGRSTGNTITLETDTISRYHISMTLEAGQVYVTDLESANGTFVDGGRLPANERFILRGGEEIQIGHLRITFHALDESPTMPVDTVQDDTQRIEKEALDFSIDLQLTHITVTPGSYNSVELTIYNHGSTASQYSVDVAGIPREWVRINRPTLEIDPEDNGLVLINIKPTRRSDSLPGDYHTHIVVRQQDQPDAYLEASLTVTIQPYTGFGMALATRRIKSGERFKLHLHNQGTTAIPLTITGYNPDGKLDFDISPISLTLAPAQRQQVHGSVRVKGFGLVGRVTDYPFDVRVQAREVPHFLAVEHGHYRHKPLLPTWAALSLGGTLAAVILILILGLLSAINAPREPRIPLFVVNNNQEQIARGQTLPLDWTVQDAAQLVVQVGEETINLPVSSESGQSQINTDDLSGEINVTLIATNGDLTTSETRRVNVYQPATITRFTVEPQTIVRHVVQTITVNWDAPGAVVDQTQVVGMNDAGPDVAITARGDAFLEAVGIPENDFTLTLTVRDEAGGTQQQTLNVVLIDPQCVAREREAIVHTVPDETAASIGTIPAEVAIRVNGLSSTGQWLRVLTDVGEGWVLRTDFICEDNFNVEDLRRIPVTPEATVTEEFSPLATVTPTPSPTPSPETPETPETLETPES